MKASPSESMSIVEVGAVGRVEMGAKTERWPAMRQRRLCGDPRQVAARVRAPGGAQNSEHASSASSQTAMFASCAPFVDEN